MFKKWSIRRQKHTPSARTERKKQNQNFLGGFFVANKVNWSGNDVVAKISSI